MIFERFVPSLVNRLIRYSTAIRAIEVPRVASHSISRQKSPNRPYSSASLGPANGYSDRNC